MVDPESEPDTPTGPTIELTRTAKQEACDSCGPLPKRVLTLEITMERNWVTLCPECEGELLRKLLSNYLKRRSRGSKAGFTGDIPKENAQGDIEYVPAWAEEIEIK